MEEQSKERKRKLDKYKTIAMCADDENRKFYDEIGMPPFQGLSVSELKAALSSQGKELAEIKEVGERAPR